MDARSLRSFLSLTETLNFSRAAAASHVSPSTLSRNIKQLEAQVGARLFERDNRSVSLTPEGELFRSYARESLALFESFQTSLMEETRELSGELTVYCSVTASYSFLFELLSELCERHPRIRIKLQTGEPEEAVARVQSGEAQISIGARPARVPQGMTFRPITSTPLLFIAPRRESGLTRVPAATEAIEWSEVPMIVPDRGIARERIDRWFRAREVTPRIWAQVAGNEAIVSMVSLGGGVGVVPRIVLENSPLADRVRTLAIDSQLEPLEVGLFVLARSQTNPLIAALWDAANHDSAQYQTTRPSP